MPSGLVLDSDVSGNLVGRDPFLGFAHESHRHEPLLQRQVGIVEQGASCSGEVQAALGTLKQSAGLSGLPFGVDPVNLVMVAGKAANAIRPTLRNQVIEGLVFGCECLGDLKEIHGRT